ncbi:MAG TPA: DedA family protein [Candidatus Sulfotelmatobacter sp.]
MTHGILEFLRSALVQYGYWAVAVALLLENAGVPFPGETVLLLASFLAYSQHELNWGLIVMVGTIAATLGDNLGYLLGYYGGRKLLERHRLIFHVSDRSLSRAEGLFARYGAVTVFFARFVFGMRIVAGPLAGVLRMPWKKFLAFNFLGAAVWVTVISGAGYLFGSQWEELSRTLKRFDLALVVAVVILVVISWLRSRRRKNRNS